MVKRCGEVVFSESSPNLESMALSLDGRFLFVQWDDQQTGLCGETYDLLSGKRVIRAHPRRAREVRILADLPSDDPGGRVGRELARMHDDDDLSLSPKYRLSPFPDDDPRSDPQPVPQRLRAARVKS